MSELDTVRIAVHQKNIQRYRWLLRTSLTEVEREYVERRLAEERQALGVPMQAGQSRQRATGRSRATASTVIAAASLADGTGGSSQSY